MSFPGPDMPGNWSLNAISTARGWPTIGATVFYWQLILRLLQDLGVWFFFGSWYPLEPVDCLVSWIRGNHRWSLRIDIPIFLSFGRDSCSKKSSSFALKVDSRSPFRKTHTSFPNGIEGSKPGGKVPTCSTWKLLWKLLWKGGSLRMGEMPFACDLG